MESSSALLDLPPEILRMILRDLLVLSRPIESLRRESESKSEKISFKVLLTCKKIYNEGVTLLYGQNIFSVASTENTPWKELLSTSEQNLAMIQRVAIRLGVNDWFPFWLSNSDPLRCLYFHEFRPRLQFLRPTDLVVDFGSNLLKVNHAAFFGDIRSSGALYRVRKLLKELEKSVWDPTPGGRPLAERDGLNDRIRETLIRIDACNTRRSILSVVSEVQMYDSTLIYIPFAHSRRPGWGDDRVLIFSSKSGTPDHLSRAFSTLICSLKIERKRVEVLEEHDHQLEGVSREIRLVKGKEDADADI